MTTKDILRVLPHRYPFLLVDRVIELQEGANPPSRVGRRAVALKNITFNESFFPGHFPDNPIMPGVLQIEAMAQASALAHWRSGDPEFDVMIAAVQDAKFRRPVTPGDQLKITAEIIKERASMLLLTCKIEVGDQVVSEAQILASVVAKAKN